MTQFAKDNGLKLIHIAGKGGTDAATKAMTGEVDCVFTALSVFENLARAGKLKVLAVAADARAEYMPNVPTFKEQGYPTLDSLWFGLIVRKGVPAAAVTALENAVKDAVNQEETKQLYAKFRFTDSYLDGPGFAKVIDANLENHKVVLKEIGLIK
jgi:tripartite-type tricarboxylate transporter receptor subunit TctC